jgi:hypothetical protein
MSGVASSFSLVGGKSPDFGNAFVIHLLDFGLDFHQLAEAPYTGMSAQSQPLMLGGLGWC